MAKIITRNGKITECRVAVFNTKHPENGVTEQTIKLNGWYKDFERGGDGYNACQSFRKFTRDEVVVMVKSHDERKEKRKMDIDEWLERSVVCDGTENESDIEND